MSRNMKLIYLSTFLSNLMFFGAITIPYFSSLAKMSYTQAFFTQSWFQFWIFLLEIPMGVLADKIGRVKTIALGLFLFSIDMVLWGLFPVFAVFLVHAFIGAIGAALVSGADI